MKSSTKLSGKFLIKFYSHVLFTGCVFLAQSSFGGQATYSESSPTSALKSLQFKLNLTGALFKEASAERELRQLFRQVLLLSGFWEDLQRLDVKDLGEIRILSLSSAEMQKLSGAKGAPKGFVPKGTTHLYLREDVGLDEAQDRRVIVHEMVHVLQHLLNQAAEDCDTWIQNEVQARRVEIAWNLSEDLWVSTSAVAMPDSREICGRAQSRQAPNPVLKQHVAFR
jgi:hypothetical protein